MTDRIVFPIADGDVTPELLAFCMGLEDGARKIINDIETYAQMIDLAGRNYGLTALGVAALEDIHQVLGERIALQRAVFAEHDQIAADPTKEDQS